MPDNWKDLLKASQEKTEPTKKNTKANSEWKSLLRSSWIGFTDYSPGSQGSAYIQRRVDEASVEREQASLIRERERQEFLIDDDPTKTTWKDFLGQNPDASVWRDKPYSGVSDFLNQASQELFKTSEVELLKFYGWTNQIVHKLQGVELPYTPGKADWDPLTQDVTEGSDPYHPASKKMIKKFDYAFETNKAITGLIAGPVSLAGVGAALVERPQEARSTLGEAGAGLLDSVNIFDPKATPAEKYGRALNLLFTVIGVGKSFEAAAPKINTLRAAGAELKIGKVKVGSVKGAFQKAGLTAAEAAEATKIIDEGVKEVKAETGFELFKGATRSKQFWQDVNQAVEFISQARDSGKLAEIGTATPKPTTPGNFVPVGEAYTTQAKADTLARESAKFDREYAPVDNLPMQNDRPTAGRVYMPLPEESIYDPSVPDMNPKQIMLEFVENTRVKSPRHNKSLPRSKAGYFDPQTASIVLGKVGDNNVFWHEVGHYSSYLFPELVRKLDDLMLKELEGLHPSELSKYDGDLKARESIAEFVRAYVLNPAEAKAQAPNFAKVFEETLAASPDGETFKARLDDAAKKLNNWNSKSATAKVQDTVQYIDTEATPTNQTLEAVKTAIDEIKPTAPHEPFRTSTIGKAKQKLTDFNAPIDEAVDYALEQLNKADPLPSKDPNLLYDRLSYTENIIKEQLAGGLRDENFNYRQPLQWDHETKALIPLEGEPVPMTLKWVLDPIKDFDNYKDAVAFGIARRIIEKGTELEYVKAPKYFEEALTKDKLTLDDFDKDIKQTLGGFPMNYLEDTAAISKGIDELKAEVKIQKRVPKSVKDKPTHAQKIRELQERINSYESALAQTVHRVGVERQNLIQRYGIERADELSARVVYEAIEKAKADPLMMEKAQASSEFLKRYQSESIGLLDYAVETGLMSEADKLSILDENLHYFDLGRDMADQYKSFDIKPHGVDSFKRQFRAFKGSIRDIKDPVTNLVENAVSVIRAGEINKARNTFFDNFRDIDHLDIYTREALSSIAEKIPDGESHNGNSIKVWKEGKPETWLIHDEALYKALKGQTPLKPNIVTQATTFAKKMITNFPPFLIKNFIRDAQDASVLGRRDIIPFVGEARSVKQLAKLISKPDSELAQHYTLGGAGMAIWNDIDNAGNYDMIVREALAQVLDEHKTGRVAERIKIGEKGKVKRGWQKVKGAAEKAPRLAQFDIAYAERYQEFKAKGLDDATAQGQAILKASEDVRGIIDFGRSGQWTREVNRYVPFLNAQIQGVAAKFNALAADMKLVRLGDAKARIRVGKRVAGLAVKFALAEYLIAQWNQQHGMTQEDYDAIPDYQKDFFYNLKVSGGYIRIPKGYAMAITQSFVANGLTGQLDEDRLQGLAKGALETNLPMTRVDQALPGLVVPVIEMATNRDLFLGKDIVPYYERDLPLELRNQKNSSLISQAIGQGLKQDSRAVDHFLNSYFGSAYKMPSTAIDMLKGDNLGERLPRLGTALLGVTVAETTGGDPDVRRMYQIAQQNGITRVLEGKFSALNELRAKRVPFGSYSQHAEELRQAKLDIIRTARELNKEVAEATKDVSDLDEKRQIIHSVYAGYR